MNFLNTSPGRPGQETMNAEELKQWMNGLNPGDSWVVASAGKLYVRKVTVVRKTPTQLVVNCAGNELRYRLKDGRRVGECYETIEPPASSETIAEARAAIKAHRLAVALYKTNWRNLPLEKLEQVAALVGVDVQA
jgi:hypothetical protein